MIHRVCDQCGKSEKEDHARGWLSVVSADTYYAGTLYEPSRRQLVAHVCSLFCLAKWAPREEIRRRKEPPIIMAMGQPQ